MYNQLKGFINRKSIESKIGDSQHLDLEKLPLSQYIDLAYQFILRRLADDEGSTHFEQLVKRKKLTKAGVIDHLVASEEFRQLHQYGNLSLSLHESRKRFIKSMPPSRKIVDLGGSAQDAVEGALVLMGYPYSFEELIIIDLPIAERHKIYQRNDETINVVESSLGPVRYHYGSMTDLSMIEDSSVDMVYSGQTIEHVTREDAQKVYQEVLRVLKPGSSFYVDTPNSKLTRLQQDEYIDPDHKYEYTSSELRGDLLNAGFVMLEEKGLNYGGKSVANDQFELDEIIRNVGVYGNADACYLLAYVCARPS